MAAIAGHVVKPSTRLYGGLGAATYLVLSVVSAAAAQSYEDGLAAAQRNDDAAALRAFRDAANHGNVPAEYNLGRMYSQGRGVPRDDAQAIDWYRKAADQGNPGAQFNLGLMYETGEGVPRDDAAAADWYLKAYQPVGRNDRHWRARAASPAPPGCARPPAPVAARRPSPRADRARGTPPGLIPPSRVRRGHVPGVGKSTVSPTVGRREPGPGTMNRPPRHEETTMATATVPGTGPAAEPAAADVYASRRHRPSPRFETATNT